MFVTVTAPDTTEGTVVTFHARDDDGTPVLVAVDHRMARAIAEALEDGPVDVRVEPWQLLATDAVPDGAA